jgi:hypothetical protein
MRSSTLIAVAYEFDMCGLTRGGVFFPLFVPFLKGAFGFNSVGDLDGFSEISKICVNGEWGLSVCVGEWCVSMHLLQDGERGCNYGMVSARGLIG